jgi:DivIVA domain-containing protein
MAVALQLLLAFVVVLVVAALVFGVVTLLSGDDPGLSPIEPDGRARPLPNHRSLTEVDLKTVRFDVELRGYRMAQVDRVLRRTAYDLGYKDEMIAVLEAEVAALREGRAEDAELLRKARESAASPVGPEHPAASPAGRGAHRAADPAEPAGDFRVAGAAGDLAGDESDKHRDDHDTERTDTDRHHEETDERREQDGEPGVTRNPTREPTADPEIPEEQAPRG